MTGQTDSIRCERCGLVRLLEQPAGAPCMSCGGQLVDTRLDQNDPPWAMFRWVPTSTRIAIEVRMTREQHDAAVREGESCECERCLNCRARQYWREGGLYNDPGEYPLDSEFDPPPRR